MFYLFFLLIRAIAIISFFILIPDIVVIPKIPIQLSQELTNARNAKKIMQKDMSNRLNIQQSVYNDIESEKAYYSNENKQLISKIERLIGLKFLNK